MYNKNYNIHFNKGGGGVLNIKKLRKVKKKRCFTIKQLDRFVH